VIDARNDKADPFSAVDNRVGWDKFVRSVAEAESLAQPETTDNRAKLIEKYGASGGSLRRCWKPSSSEERCDEWLLRAVTLIRNTYRAGKRPQLMNAHAVRMRPSQSWGVIEFWSKLTGKWNEVADFVGADGNNRSVQTREMVTGDRRQM